MTNTNSEAVRQLVKDGLQAVKAAADAGEKSAAKIMDAASHSGLKQALTRGTELTSTWRQRVETAQQSMGESGTENEGVIAGIANAARQVVGASDSHIIDAIYRTGREIEERAEDSQSRDLGIVSTGQLALHYYIAAFGSLANYADYLGDEETARLMKQCDEEAKAEDRQHTELANQILAG